MITTTTSSKTQETMVGMGQIVSGGSPQQMKAIVGSCIALALHHPRLNKGVMAHIVLPDSAGRPGAPGKFADTAIPRMLELFKELGVPAHSLTAKLAGGANMFANSGPLQIGDANTRAVAQALRTAGIRIMAQDVGGTRGRRVTFDCADGEMIIESAGQPKKTL
jgi:chemotaxis protein CheD